MSDIVLIDRESGLTRVGGNMGLYKRLLSKYVEGDYIEKLDGHLASSSITEATADAHTIKGVAANLSLMRVNAAALALEQKLKAGGDFTDEANDLRDAHFQTIAEISTL